jgi:predicted phage terminase large subunit-like protein
MVSGVLAMVEGRPKIYILGNVINERLSFHETIQQMKSLSMGLKAYGAHAQFYVEKVAYQQAAIEEAQRNMIPVTAVTPGVDKRARLRTAATFIQNGTVEFADRGCEDLISQLLGFGVEQHDDIVDALVYLILSLADEGMNAPQIIAL